MNESRLTRQIKSESHLQPTRVARHLGLTANPEGKKGGYTEIGPRLMGQVSIDRAWVCFTLSSRDRKPLGVLSDAAPQRKQNRRDVLLSR